MDTKNGKMKCDCGCSGCGGGGMMHGWGGGHRFSILRLFVGVILLCVIFSAGVRLGELKGFIKANSYGYGMMRNSGWNQNGMMNQGINGTYPYGGSPQGGVGLPVQ